MSISETSIEAFESIIDQLPRRRGEVLTVLIRHRGKGRTRQEIADDLGLRANSVNGRVRELIDSNMAHEKGRRVDTLSGRDCNIVHVGKNPDATEGE